MTEARGYTRIPNEIIDEHLPNLSCGELRVFLFICRQTVGWNKEADSMSLKQLMDGIGESNKGTGLTKKSVLSALKGLDEKGLVKHERQENDRLGHVASRYSLGENLYQACSKKDTTLGVESITRVGGESTTSPWHTNDPTQKTVEQKTLPKEKDDVGQAEGIVGEDVFAAILKKLMIAATSEEDAALVAESIVTYPKLQHKFEAGRCRSNKRGAWNSMTSAQRAFTYAGWLQRQANPPSWASSKSATTGGDSASRVIDLAAKDRIAPDMQARFQAKSDANLARLRAQREGGPSAAAQ